MRRVLHGLFLITTVGLPIQALSACRYASDQRVEKTAEDVGFTTYWEETEFSEDFVGLRAASIDGKGNITIVADRRVSILQYKAPARKHTTTRIIPPAPISTTIATAITLGIPLLTNTKGVVDGLIGCSEVLSEETVVDKSERTPTGVFTWRDEPAKEIVVNVYGFGDQIFNTTMSANGR